MDASHVGEKQTDHERDTKERGGRSTFESLVNILATSEKYEVTFAFKIYYLIAVERA